MNKIFNCTTNSTSKIITLNNTTNINDTDLLFNGLYLYSEAVKSCAVVTNIIDDTTIEISENPIKTGDYDIVFSDLVPYKYLDLCESLKDVQDIVNNNGQFIRIVFRNENDLTRDDYNSIDARKRQSILDVKAHPILFDPTTDQIEKAGFFEKQDVIVWLARKDLIDNNYEFDNFDELRDTVKINGETFRINDKNKRDFMGNEYLYFVLGLGKI